MLQTFPHIEDQLRFVYFGTAEYNIAGVADLRQPRPRGRRPRDRLVRPDAGAGRHVPAASSPTPRSSPSCATSATRSAAPTRRATSTPRSTRTGARRSRRCSSPSRPARRSTSSPTPASPTPRASRSTIIAIGDAPARRLAPGVTVERHRARADRRSPTARHDRGPRRRRRPGRRRGRLLAGPPRPRRHRRREEGVPAGEDVRRRADATSRQAARRHGARRPS